MKTILVPTEPNALMRSTLETALLVAREFNSYIEGFAVRVAVPNVLAMDVAPSGSLAFFEEENAPRGSRASCSKASCRSMACPVRGSRKKRQPMAGASSTLSGIAAAFSTSL